MKDRSTPQVYEAHTTNQSSKRQKRTKANYPASPFRTEKMADLERANRLRQARRAAGYRRPVDAVNAFGWNRSTYFGHENGSRGISRDRLAVYASALHVRVDWLAYGQGSMRIGSRRIRIEGHLGDLATIAERNLEADEVELIEGLSSEDFAAYRLHGDTYYPVWRDRDVVFVPRAHGSPDDYVGQRCLVTLPDGNQLIRTVMRGARIGLFALLSHNAPPIMDTEIVDAVPIAWCKYEG